MKFTTSTVLLAGVLPSLSFVIPDEVTTNQVFLQGSKNEASAKHLGDFEQAFQQLEANLEKKLGRFVDKAEKLESVIHEIEKAALGGGERIMEDLFSDGKTAIDDAFDEAFKLKEKVNSIPDSFEFFDAEAWASQSVDSMFSEPQDDGSEDKPKHPHHPKPPFDHFPRPHIPGFPHRDPHGPHPDSTVLDLLSKSNHTSIFYDLVKDDKELVDILSNTSSNITVFVPSNQAFEKIPKHGKKHDIPKDVLRKILLYHIVDGTHQACNLIRHNTLVSKAPEEDLGKDMHQRLRIGLGLHGLAVNFYSKIFMVDVYAKNGVIHGVDSILLPPPSIQKIVQLLPTVFSTSAAALVRADLIDTLDKDLAGKGVTVFLPTNRDWAKLGLKINAFLFSDIGKPYLTALMKYHFSPANLLYSDAYVVPDDKKDPEDGDVENTGFGFPHRSQHVDLSTLLEGRHITADITRFARFLRFRINGFNRIVMSDGIAKNGVIQVPDHVLFPPHSGEKCPHHGELEVEELKAILNPLLEEKHAGL